MSRIDELYDLYTLRDNLENANSEIQEDGIREEYSYQIEEILEGLKLEIEILERIVKKEIIEEKRQQEREYREMVGM